jgi:hypothetical protein
VSSDTEIDVSVNLKAVVADFNHHCVRLITDEKWRISAYEYHELETLSDGTEYNFKFRVPKSEKFVRLVVADCRNGNTAKSVVLGFQ